jgi:hypothetical protein
VKLELGRGEKCGQERKERNEGDARVLYGQREGRGSGRGVAASGLAIDGRRAKRRKEQKEGGNGM